MTTVGPELTSFIDPSLTWKAVSKGRNTSRRSRRPVSKIMEMVQEQEKRSPKRPNSSQCSEPEKSNIMTHGRRFPGNLEHIPIKKRRFFFRSPSPPLQSPNRLIESEGNVGGQSISEQHTHSNVITESQVPPNKFSDGSKLNDCYSDIIIDETSMKSSNEAHGSGEDFSGIAILAAVACSDRLDNCTDDVGKSQSLMCGLLDREQNESFASAFEVKESITIIQSSEMHGKDTEHVEGICVIDLPKDHVQVVSVNNDSDDVGMSQINESQKAEQNESQKAEQNESIAFTSVNKGSVDCVTLPDLVRSDDVLVNEETLTSLPDEDADRSPENSDTTRDCRFHWDLNTVMDEWDHPLDDKGVDSSTQLVDVAPTHTLDFQNLEDLEGSKAKGSEIQNSGDVEGLEAKRSEATESGDRVTSQAEICAEAESMTLQDNAGVTSINPSFSRIKHCLEVSSAFATSIIKENTSLSDTNNHVVETSLCASDLSIQPEVVDEDATIDHSLSLGLNGIKISAAEETSNGEGSGNANEVAEETYCSIQTLQPKKHEIGFLLAPLTENVLSEVKDPDCKNVDDFKVMISEKVNEVEKVMYQTTATNSLGRRCDVASLDTSESGEASCEVKDLNCKISDQSEQVTSFIDCEVKHREISGGLCQSSLPETQMAELKDSSVSPCSSKVEDMVTTSITIGNDQAVDRVFAEEFEDKPTVACASGSDPLSNLGSEVLVPKMLDHSVAVDACSKPIDPHPAEKSLGCGHGSHVSNGDSSLVTENVGTVVEMEVGYESHLEDGELRESHFWEENEGEEGETEHVDYDSDNREGVVFYDAANDSAQMSGQFLVGDCEKQSYRSDNFSTADDQLNADKGIEEKCSQRFQGSLLTVDAMDAVCAKRESLALKACSGANDSDKVEMDQKDCRSSIEADATGKSFDNEPPRNARGASASGREMQFSDSRYTDRMRRSRSGNFDCMHHSDGPEESSLTRSQQPLQRIGRFGGRSWNPELKNIVANSASEDDGERIFRSSGDTSPIRGRRPRIINTSRSGYQFVRRGSPGDRDGDYGMDMMKLRDISPDNNPRSRFGRFNVMNRGGFREGYRRPGFYEGLKSGGGVPMLNRFGRRDRSFSPVGDRFHRKSRSRSRTRSPDFRPEARMGRGRPPYQQANHSAEHTRERRSPVRVFNQSQRFDAIGSPGRLRSDDLTRPTMRPMRFHDATTSGRGHDFEEGDDFRRKPLLIRNHRRSRSRSRSCSPEFRPDTRIGSMRVPYQQSGVHIRDRRSPVRVFRPDQRYEGGGSPVRLRSDECMRPMMRPLRFPESAQPGRGNEFNNNNNNSNNNGDEYRRKPRNIFERIHPIRHYDVEDVRRFQYDNEQAVPNQTFRRNENFARTGERRPAEFNRGPREERGNVRYNNSDRMFYSGPKQFGGGMRDYGGEDDLPRRVRP